MIDGAPRTTGERSCERDNYLSNHTSIMAAIHTHHLSHAFTNGRDIEPLVVLEDVNISLPIGSRTLLVAPTV